MTNANLEELIQVDTEVMVSPNELDVSRLNKIALSFSDRVNGEDGEERKAPDEPDFNSSSGIAEHKDDKLTQSQVLKRMIEAEERDNQMDRRRATEAVDREESRLETKGHLIKLNGLNDARLFSSANRSRVREVES